MSHSLRERALRLLARREHARGELARKLMPHAESEEELTGVLEDLAARGLLSDERYVEMRLHARAARFGNARLTHELRQQGVDEAVVIVQPAFVHPAAAVGQYPRPADRQPVGIEA